MSDICGVGDIFVAATELIPEQSGLIKLALVCRAFPNTTKEETRRSRSDEEGCGSTIFSAFFFDPKYRSSAHVV